MALHDDVMIHKRAGVAVAAKCAGDPAVTWHDVWRDCYSAVPPAWWPVYNLSAQYSLYYIYP